jgi:hypothetical protein
MKYEFFYIFKKLFLLIFIIIVIDFFLGFILEKIYHNVGGSWFPSITYALNECNEEIIILGTSRANHHYVSELISKETGLSCYNAGRDGQSLLYDYTIFKSILNRYSPQIIIVDINKNSLLYNKTDYDRLAQFNPYYSTNEAVRNIINLKDKKERYFVLSKLYTYNSALLRMLKNFKRNREYVDGYVPLYNSMSTNNHINDSIRDGTLNGKLDPNKVKILNDMITESRKNNIALYFFESPYYSVHTSYQNNSKEVIDSLCLLYNVEYFDYSNVNGITHHARFFSDESHLNNDGANVYTKIVVEDLKNDLDFPD